MIRVLFIALLCPMLASGQELYMDALPMLGNEPGYRDTVRVDSVPAAELLARAAHFLRGRYRGVPVQVDTTNGHRAEVNGAMLFYWQPVAGGSVQAYAGHTLRVECKHGRYRYTIESICITYHGTGDEFGERLGGCHDVVVWNQGRPLNKKRALLNVHAGLRQQIEDLKLMMSVPVPVAPPAPGAPPKPAVTDDW